jgi:aspartyl-tRNA(Asn)/glutamyl-tRNA(Gln) amidotransferase subunit B
MPKNYQITQFDQPLCLGGQVSFELNGEQRTVRLNRIHLEEDVGKNTHFDTSSGVDYNRAGTPLMEIVTEADLHSEEEAFAYLQALKEILEYGGVSNCNLEEGNIRCDVNTSVAPKGSETLGVKTEVKNMNTFKGVRDALGYEIRRQKREVATGGTIVQTTIRWDDVTGKTSAMRSKEYAHDYRYFPDPDLMPIVLDESYVDELRTNLPELPAARRTRYIEDFGLPEYDAGVLVANRDVAEFFEATTKHCSNRKVASNFVMGDMMRMLNEQELSVGDIAITPEALGGLVQLFDDKKVNNQGAKTIFEALFAHGGDPGKIAEEKDLIQKSDAGDIEPFVLQVIDEHAGPVADYQNGKEAALQFLVGQVMRLSRGKANPQVVAGIFKEKLGA